MGRAQQSVERGLYAEDGVPNEVADPTEREDTDADDARPITDRDPRVLANQIDHPQGSSGESGIEQGVPRREERLERREIAMSPSIDKQPRDQPQREDGSDKVFSDRRPSLRLMTGEGRLRRTGHPPSLAPVTLTDWHNSKPLHPTLPTSTVQSGSNPVAAPRPFHDGEETVLTFQGDAEAVHLITWMPMFPAPPPFTRVADGLWQLRLRLPPTARIEYRLAITLRGRTRQIDDPANPPTAPNPFGANSVLTGRSYQLPSFVREPVEPIRGQLHEVRVTSGALGRRHHYHVYLPEGFKARTGHPVLLVHDGTDFLRFGDLGGVLDRLIDSGAVASVAVVLLDPWNRIAEYGANPAHSQHLVGEVIPHIVRRLRLNPTEAGALGSSLGAVAALAAAWHNPQALAKLALLSGSFAHTHVEGQPREVFAPVIEFMADFEADPRLEKTAVFQSAGRYERLCDLNRRLAPIIGAAAIRHEYRETWDGHHWGSWRDRLGDALSFLFPGPARLEGKG